MGGEMCCQSSDDSVSSGQMTPPPRFERRVARARARQTIWGTAYCGLLLGAFFTSLRVAHRCQKHVRIWWWRSLAGEHVSVSEILAIFRLGRFLVPLHPRAAQVDAREHSLGSRVREELRVELPVRASGRVTTYSLQRPETFAAWAAATPDDFIFSVKGSRYIAHMLRLGDEGTPLANFFASGVLRLERKLGPILWQLPPRTKFRAERIEGFLRLLPKDTESAAALARRHDKRVSGRSWMKANDHRPLRHCIEIRHDSFAVPEFIECFEPMASRWCAPKRSIGRCCSPQNEATQLPVATDETRIVD